VPKLNQLRLAIILMIIFQACYCQLFSSEIKVRVIKEGALLKLMPDVNSQTIQNIPPGAILKMIETIGDWAKVKLPPDENNIEVIGYIHSSYLESELHGKLPEEIKPKPDATIPQTIEPIKKRNDIETVAEENKANYRFEISLFGGYSNLNISSSSTYYDTWSYYHLSNVIEDNNIAVGAENVSNFGGSVAFYFSKNFGVQFQISSNSKSNINTTTDFNFDWTWDKYSYPGGSYSETFSWNGKGELDITQFSLNIIGKMRFSFFEPYVSIGVTLFSLGFNADAYAGLGISGYYDYYWYWQQYIDAVQARTEVTRTTWSSLGPNLGIGFNLAVYKYIVVFAELKYFICPEKEFEWEWKYEYYDGLWGHFIDVLLIYADPISKLKINPSYTDFHAGIKFSF